MDDGWVSIPMRPYLLVVRDSARVPLADISIDQARRVARRIVHEESDVTPVKVAAFESSI